MKEIKPLTRAIVITAVVLIIFTVVMIILYILTGSVPDTLIHEVFTAGFGEFGVCGIIKTVNVIFLEKVEKEKKKQQTIDALKEQEKHDRNGSETKADNVPTSSSRLSRIRG